MPTWLLDASGTVVDGPASYAYSTPGGVASITGGYHRAEPT